MLRERPLVFTGFMATGKSTVGRLAAARAGVPFADLDDLIEARAGASMASIFSQRGESAFRELEAAELARALEPGGPRVLSVGGGALLDDRIRRDVLERATVITLRARPETLVARTEGSPRPLLVGAADPEARIRSLLGNREAAYAEAHAQLSTDEKTADEVAEEALAVASREAWVVPLGHATYCVSMTPPGGGQEALLRELSALSPSSIFLVTDAHVAPHVATPLAQALSAAQRAIRATITLEPGETNKQLSAVEGALRVMIEAGADRDAVVVAVGGGVVSDIAGFAAATLFRGVRWVGMPTTLLAMVDASVGGKTGVDAGLAKNAIGAFHQPSAVLLDPSVLRTEPRRSYVSGLAEVVKSAALGDPALLDFLESNASAVLARDPTATAEIASRSVAVKARIVGRDPREKGERAVLNLGHTLGHALEAAGEFTTWTHGEAVSLGLVAALRMGVGLGLTPASLATRIARTLATLGLPTVLARVDLERALPYVAYDKKRGRGGLRLVLLRDLGQPTTRTLPLDEFLALALRYGTG
jgi:shikimate kinase/3-dehydroquinate synthase